MTDDDTLPEWLWRRFCGRVVNHADWLYLAQEDREYWAHEAAAVRRAVARDGFKRD